MMHCDRRLAEQTLTNATQQLLDCRVEGGYWEGELASSALSTATAIFAMLLLLKKHEPDNEQFRQIIIDGAQWLITHQNADGGWGDTVLSLSNISTTTLCWAALAAIARQFPDSATRWNHALERSASWLQLKAGSLEPDKLIHAITDRYGEDRTFSVPILTMCVLAGQLGNGVEAWRRIPQLPFELAAVPAAWYRWLQMPVVSYALPALIAIGQVRHTYCPTSNPPLRLVRELVRRRTLRLLGDIQPCNGGFLEAVPLTSFVVMSLIAAGQVRHPVVRRGVAFLTRSARRDGSFPIDTNLATWVTTLAINALAWHPEFVKLLSIADLQRLRDWLLQQQYRHEHPYTHAAPGGWAWTDRPGGVPDADDTAGALLALRQLGPVDAEVQAAAVRGVRWLLDLQNHDGGIPTFCRGWHNLPFDRSGVDLTAHALSAWYAWLKHLPPGLAARTWQAATRALDYLACQQRPDGAWIPLWFGNQYAAGEENPTYGTARVLLSLAPLAAAGYTTPRRLAAQGVRWLLSAQNADGGWGGNPGVASSIEETALAVQALTAVPDGPEVQHALARGVAWLVEHTDCGRTFPPAPIGFYFAKLWYYEKLYPLIFTVAALARVCRRWTENG